MLDAGFAELVTVLLEARAALARPENDFASSGWDGREDALRELDAMIALLRAGSLPAGSTLEVLFGPTGPIQDVSVRSGWGRAFLALAARFDAAMANVR